MRATLLVICLFSASARAQQAVELFADQGSFFIRAGSKSGVKVGNRLTLTGDAEGTRSAGSATVMEVWEAMSRVNLDEAAKKSKPRFAFLDEPSRSNAAAPLPSPPPPPPSTYDGTGPQLHGHAEWGNLGRVIIFNDGDTAWNACEARLPDDSVYRFGTLGPRSDEGILAFKFRREHLPPNDRLLVQCDQGDGTFFFSRPKSTGALKGYVERGNMGRIILHNDSDADWTRCVLRQPDQTYYTLGTLRAGSDEGVMPTRFRLENMPPLSYVVVRCKQGEAKFDLD